MAAASGAVSASDVERRVRVLIADDHSAIRNIVRSTIEEHPRFEVCGEADNGAKAIDEAERLKPDVVVLNISMPLLNGFQAARKIKASVPQSAIVILSSHADQQFVEEARRIGVQAYVAKTKAGEALVNAIERALLGNDFVALG